MTEPPWEPLTGFFFIQRIRHANHFSTQKVPNHFPERQIDDERRQEGLDYCNPLWNRLLIESLIRA
jgi:hypothetical protein